MKNRSWRIHPDDIHGAVIATGYGKPVSEQVRAEQLLQLEYLKDTGCVIGIKRSLEEAESDNDTVPVEEDCIRGKVAPRAHKRAMRKAAKQLEEDMSYFDSDEECNKSEYA